MPLTDPKILKKLYNAFDPTPLHPDIPEEWALYIDLQVIRGDSNILRDIGQHIEWSDKPTCQLYAGHRGAGKSTELLRLKQHLERAGYFVVYFAADEGEVHLEAPSDLNIFLACTRQLINSLEEVDLSALRTLLQSFYEIASNIEINTNIDIETAKTEEIKVDFNRLITRLNDHIIIYDDYYCCDDYDLPGFLDSSYMGFLNALNNFIKTAIHQNLVLIIDNLDRIVSIYNENIQKTNHEEIFIDQAERLKALNCHVIYTVPISLMYSKQRSLLKNCYENIGYLPMATVMERGSRTPFEPGLMHFLESLEKRMQLAAGCGIDTVFDGETVVRELCLLSGGYLRDLMKLVQGTLWYLPQFKDVEKAAARAVIQEREAYLDTINEEDWERLAVVYQDQQILNEQDYRQLLFNHSVLEYQSAALDTSQNTKWHDVHPLLVETEQFKKALQQVGGSSETAFSYQTFDKINANLKLIHLQGFSVFENAVFDELANMNFFIGENSSGKSQILKTAYLTCRMINTKLPNENDLSDHLIKVFRLKNLTQVVSNFSDIKSSQLALNFDDEELNISFEILASNNVDIKKCSKNHGLLQGAIFFPTKEAISMFPNFGGLYRDYHIEIDETYYDLCLALERPLLKSNKHQAILEKLETIIGGRVIIEGGRFYLEQANQQRIEMHLLAEGLRKIATLAYLIANDSIVGNILFWDEPESNLNPKLMHQLAEILVLLAQKNTQIFIATHSLFLLREFELLLKTHYSDVSSRYFGLTRQDNGSVTVSAGNDIDELDSIAALEAEILQSEEYYQLIAEDTD